MEPLSNLTAMELLLCGSECKEPQTQATENVPVDCQITDFEEGSLVLGSWLVPILILTLYSTRFEGCNIDPELNTAIAHC